MLTLLATLLGFVSSVFPNVLKLIQDRANRQHELAILDKQLNAQREGYTQHLKEIQTQADMAESQALYQHASIPSGVKWVEALRASVRPVVTYAFFGLFAFVKVTVLITSLHYGFTLTECAEIIWDEETRALFAAVIAFWFGHRSVTRSHQTQQQKQIAN